MRMLGKVLVGAVPVIALLVAAAFLPVSPSALLLRQLVLAAIGIGGIMVAERLLFGGTWGRGLTTIGFTAPQPRAVIVAVICGFPMWLFLPVYGSLNGIPVGLQLDWMSILLGVILVNGLAEEAIHRGFIFGHLRREHSFIAAACLSAAIFAAQHLYLMLTIGTVPGIASVALAALLAFPLAFMFERGGNSIAAPAILHTSSNAPVMLFALPPEMGSVLLPHMGVVLVSIYLCFAFSRWLPKAKSV
jgi:membrane protease YdiL (CAAX protease family)